MGDRGVVRWHPPAPGPGLRAPHRRRMSHQECSWSRKKSARRGGGARARRPGSRCCPAAAQHAEQRMELAGFVGKNRFFNKSPRVHFVESRAAEDILVTAYMSGVQRKIDGFFPTHTRGDTAPDRSPLTAGGHRVAGDQPRQAAASCLREGESSCPIWWGRHPGPGAEAALGCASIRLLGVCVQLGRRRRGRRGYLRAPAARYVSDCRSEKCGPLLCPSSIGI